MKIHLCSEVVRDLDFVAQCRFAREVGYDGLEIAPFTLGAEPHLLSTAKIAELWSIAEGEGVIIAGLHWLLGAPEGLSITADDDTIAERTREVGLGLIDLCGELGGEYLVHGSPAQRQLEAGNEAACRARGHDYFAAMADHAMSAGLIYIVEPLSRQDTAYINSVDETVSLIASIGSQSLTSMIDCYAAVSNGEDVPALLHHWLPKGVIGHIHFNDHNRRGPGEGTTDFAAILKTLGEFGYQHAAAVEPFIYEPDGPACAARSIGYLRGLMQGLS